jgi:uroporphyrinogen-III synthase
LALMLVTRPEPDARETAARLADLGIEVMLAPLLTLAPLEIRLPPAEGYDGVVLTSANAVRALDARNALTPWLPLTAWCVGDRTAELALDAGFSKARSAGGGMKDLAGLLLKECAGGRLIYPCGEVVSGDLAGEVAPDVRIERMAVYAMRSAENLPEAVTAGLSNGQIGSVLLYSQRSAELFVRLAGANVPRGGIAALCLSEKVAGPMLAAGFSPVAVADNAREDAMLALASTFSRGEMRA